MANHNSNPFMDGFKMFTDGSAFNNAKAMPGIDMNNIISMQRRAAEKVTEANQAAAENLQAMMRRKSEIMQSGAADMFQLVKEMAISPNLEVGMSKMTRFTQDSIKKAAEDTREISEMLFKSTMEVFDMMAEGMAESMGECAKTCATGSSSKKKTA
jgi:phasin family protein